MLVNLNEILLPAKENGYAVVAVNIDNEHNLRAAIQAAEELDSPIILNVTPDANPDIIYFGKIMRDLAANSPMKICLNLDHGKSYESCITGIRAGFTNIMIDRSQCEIKENIKDVKEIVKIAHSLNITVEAELGHVGIGASSDNIFNSLTRVEEAIRFVKETKVDALAVAIGTAHGIYTGKPKLQFELLEELSSNIEIPLVLHGGSSSGDENLQRCIELGIQKINISNDLKRAAIEELTSFDLSGNEVYNLYTHLFEGYKNKVKDYICLFGSMGKNNE